mgnify:FL=1
MITSYNILNLMIQEEKQWKYKKIEKIMGQCKI